MPPWGSVQPAASRALMGAFGVAATYTPSGGASQSVRVIREVEPGRASGEVFQVAGSAVHLTALASEVPNLGEGDAFELDGVTYVLPSHPPAPSVSGLVTFPVVEQ